MTTLVKDILYSFEHLSEDEKKELASEILRRTAKFDLPALADEDLMHCAENLFLELEQREAKNASS